MEYFCPLQNTLFSRFFIPALLSLQLWIAYQQHRLEMSNKYWFIPIASTIVAIFVAFSHTCIRAIALGQLQWFSHFDLIPVDSPPNTWPLLVFTEIPVAWILWYYFLLSKVRVPCMSVFSWFIYNLPILGMISFLSIRGFGLPRLFDAMVVCYSFWFICQSEWSKLSCSEFHTMEKARTARLETLKLEQDMKARRA